MKIRSVLIITLACFSLLAMIVFNIYINSKMTATAETIYSDLIENVAVKQANNVETYFSSLQRKISVLSLDKALIDYEASSAIHGDTENELYLTASASFENCIAADSSVSALYLVGSDGKIVLCSDRAKERNYFVNTLMSSSNELQVYIDTLAVVNRSADFEAMIYKNIGKSKLVMYMKGDYFKSFFTQSTFPVNGRIILFDPHYAVLDTTYVGNINEIDRDDYAQCRGLVTSGTLSEGETERIDYIISQNKRITYLSTIGETGWHIAATGEADKAYTYSVGASTNITNTVIFVSVIALLANVIFVIFFTKPLYVIEETLLRIRRGDHEARININSRTEYGEIAKAFNALIEDIIVSEGRYRTIIEMSDNIIFEWNFNTNEVFFSNNFNKKFSYRAPSDLFGDSFFLKCKVHPDDADRYRKDLDRLSKGEALKQNEYRWKNIYGDYIWVLLRTTVLRDSNGEISRIVGVIVDIDRAKKSEKLLTMRASYDSLTGLYNRETVESLINNEIELVTARKSKFAILFIDVDDFKIYNDRYSHATGDQVLKFTANTIQGVISEFGIAGRYGGDEFVVCVRNCDINAPARVAQDILNKLKEGFVCDLGERLTVQVSIGISIIRDSSKRVDEIIGLADDAMYKIKKNGKSNYGFFE